nr:RNA-directed DNA polymerase, eukaryota, reverse transcriptase zinc-binding domain protein [Tanacetum cinerariifolium]GEV32524.1 RNA-directed DNA polymerase, eukaryota, reverse transcriptase zinc-binding domain protein [Tanacetum cinerariifolium]
MENLHRNFSMVFKKEIERFRGLSGILFSHLRNSKAWGVSSFFALNRGLLAKGVWRFLSQDNSLWCQLIFAIHGSSTKDLSTAYPSTWNSIIKEFNYLKVQGVDVLSHCKIRIGNWLHTRFWKDLWIGDCTLSGLFPRLFALDTVKDISVAGKLQSPLVSSFRRNVRGGIEEQQIEHLVALLDSVILSNSTDRRVSDLNGDGVFRVKDVRNLLDAFFLPRADVPTRDVTRLLCRWWNLGVQSFSSYAECPLHDPITSIRVKGKRTGSWSGVTSVYPRIGHTGSLSSECNVYMNFLIWHPVTSLVAFEVARWIRTLSGVFIDIRIANIRMKAGLAIREYQDLDKDLNWMRFFIGSLAKISSIKSSVRQALT